MKLFGMTSKECFAFGIGSAVNGALLGAMIHSMFFVVLNCICLGLNVYYFNAATEKENGPSN